MKSTSVFDGMTTAELEEMLRRDLRGEGEELDAETVLAALTVLESRDADRSDCDAAAMWSRFEERRTGDSSVDDIDDIAEADAPAEEKPEKRRGRLPSFVRRAGYTLIAATLLVALVSAVLIATGHGENMWQAISGIFGGDSCASGEYDGMLLGRDGSVTEGQNIKFELKSEDDTSRYTGWVETADGLKVSIEGGKLKYIAADGSPVNGWTGEDGHGGVFAWYDDPDLGVRVYFAQNCDFIMVEDTGESSAGLYVAKSPDMSDEQAAELFEAVRAAVTPSYSVNYINWYLHWYQNPFVAIPPLDAISNMEYADIVSALFGKRRDDIIAVWGEPHGSLSGKCGEIWFAGVEERITVYYSTATVNSFGPWSDSIVTYVIYNKPEEVSPSVK